MGGDNIPFLFLAIITVLVTVLLFMLLDLPLWGGALAGLVVSIAGLLGIDIILNLVEKRHHHNRKPRDNSMSSTARQGEQPLPPLPIGSDDRGLPKAPKNLSCPSCSASDIAVIVYGLPAFSKALKKALAKGQMTLGGCLIYDGAPQWACNLCHTTFGSVRTWEQV